MRSADAAGNDGWENAGVPTLARPPIPLELQGLVSLGFNQTKLAMLSALARLGGSATTAVLAAKLPEIPKPTLHYHLAQLEQSQYVLASVERSEGPRSGRAVEWTLNSAAIDQDLSALQAALHPRDERVPQSEGAPASDLEP